MTTEPGIIHFKSERVSQLEIGQILHKDLNLQNSEATLVIHVSMNIKTIK